MKARHEFLTHAEYVAYLLHYYAGLALQGRIAALPQTIGGYEGQLEVWRKDYGDTICVGDAIAKDAYNIANSLIDELNIEQ